MEGVDVIFEDDVCCVVEIFKLFGGSYVIVKVG